MSTSYQCESDEGPTGLAISGPFARVVLERLDTVVPRRRVRMLVDTGAQITHVCRDVLELMEIPSTGRRVPVASPNTEPHWEPVYQVGVWLMVEPKPVRVDPLVVPMARESSSCDGVLGRDFLRHFQLFYDGVAGTAELRSVGDSLSFDDLLGRDPQ